MKTKRRLEIFAFWQPEEICRHLEKMAQKGWLLLEINHPFWTYRQIPPQKISFDIAYFASASEYDFQLSQGQEEFRDLCAHDGWELACTYGQMMIFYNTRENPTPLETEPELKLEAIHTYAMKHFLRILGVLLLLLLLRSRQMIAQLQQTPISVLTDNQQLFSMFCLVLFGIAYLVQGLLYLRWYTQAKYAAQAGFFLNPGNFSGMLRGTVGGFLVLWAYQVSLSFPAETALQQWCIVGLFAFGLFVYIISISITQGFLKGRNWSKETVRTITWLAAAVGMLVLAWALMWGIRQIRGEDFGQQTQLSNGVEEIPLTMEDLTAQTYDDYTIEAIGQESILLGRQIVAQLPEIDDSTKPKLRYTLVDVKVSWLYDLCLEELLHGQKRKGVQETYTYQTMDPAPWGAAEAYQGYDMQGSIVNRYLLCYDKLIAEIALDWEPTSEQIGIIRNRMEQINHR